MHREYGVSLVGLFRDIARKIEFYAQGLWGKFSGAIRSLWFQVYSIVDSC